MDGVPVTYDQPGNLTSDATWTYTSWCPRTTCLPSAVACGARLATTTCRTQHYSASGRMVRAESLTATQVYTYNGDGLLVAQSLDGVETAFTWDECRAGQVAE